jgi:ubiquinone/menaquinone biosynthesis C-methylase UbiE
LVKKSPRKTIVTYEKVVSEHYTHGKLLGTIQASLSKLGKTIDNITIEDLAPLDEFHIGGRLATNNLLDQVNFSGQDHILDVGCGLGGASRFVASKYNNRVTGIDLTQEYVEVGKVLCNWLGLDKQVTLQQGSALAMPFEKETFDGAFMLHVGMNIDDKEKLFAEIYRLLRPGAFFAVYDVMRINDGELSYPVPWATENSSCRLSTPDEYKQALNSAGFTVSIENNRRQFALDLFKKMRAKREERRGLPSLGLHTLMEEKTAMVVKNMISGIVVDLIAPVELIARR